jgi:hypothetical protein
MPIYSEKLQPEFAMLDGVSFTFVFAPFVLRLKGFYVTIIFRLCASSPVRLKSFWRRTHITLLRNRKKEEPEAITRL